MRAAIDMVEPHRSKFIALLHDGAALRDIHCGERALQVPTVVRASNAFIDRELHRVSSHIKSICAFIDATRFRPNGRILDAGCGTAALSVALAIQFPTSRIQAFDADAHSIEAAGVRVAAHGMEERVSLDVIAAGTSLPYAPGTFGLVTCASVIEFVTDEAMRLHFLRALADATAPDGMLLITTPNPLYVRELHTRRMLQNWRRAPDAPWAPTRRWIAQALPEFDYLTASGKTPQVLRRRFGRLPATASAMGSWVDVLRPWQFLCFRKKPA